jgi:surface protein
VPTKKNSKIFGTFFTYSYLCNRRPIDFQSNGFVFLYFLEMMNIPNKRFQMKSRFLSVILTTMAILMPAKLLAQEPYAVISNENTVLTFYYDDQKDARGGMDVGPFDSYETRGWNEYVSNITYVVFDESFADYTNLTSTAYWFYGLNHLNDIANIHNLKTNDVTTMFAMFYGCYSITSLDLAYFNTENVTNMEQMFYGCSGLYFLDLSSFNTANVTVMTGMFSECSSLAAIIAGNANIPAQEYAKIANPNLLVYVNEASLAPTGVQNVVIDGTAKEIILKDADGNNNWYCPQPFTAEKISYTRNFQQKTQIGVARGWESIALPFDVQTITYEDNRTITPFDNYGSVYHFWLRRLTQNGLQSVQEINANVAYVISMPNSSEYPGEYNLAGNVTFSAENAPIPETEPEMDESADRAMAPAFQRMEADEYIYALNVGEPRGSHPEGSVFEKNYREVRPFEAFTKHFGDNGSRFMSIADMLDGGVTGIEELKNGKIEEWKSESWYDLNGRRVLSPSKGVFIQNGKKIVVK